MHSKTALALLLFLSLASCTAPRIAPPVAQLLAPAERAPAATEPPPAWAYDAGPDLSTPMGRELVDLNSNIPDFPGVSSAVTGGQKFRGAFGPIPWRMLQNPNSVKILFIGQDGTHIAEAAGRPATAGFGGRAQDLARYFGVSSSAAFINTYAFTIRGQYGSFDAPILHKKPDGSLSVSYGAFVDNPLWLITQDPESPIVQWRNRLIEWIIRNNRDSLRMIVLFGGAARDAAATFVESKGAKVGTRTPAADLASLQVPEAELESTGGNNESPVPLSRSGEDLYAEALGHAPDYSKPDELAAAQKAFSQAVKADPAKWLGKMVVPKGGVSGSGVISPAQLGGFDLDRQMEVNGHPTLSIKGLKISDDLVLDHDVLLVQLPHPTALSKMAPAEAAKKVGEAVKAFKPYVDHGWTIAADPGLTNSFAAGQPYAYGRAQMGPEYYDFGAPASRMVDVSTASRLSANVIVFGTRDKAEFDKTQVRAMTDAKPSKAPPAAEMWTARPRLEASRYVFDPGPSEKYARIMKENLPQDLIKKHASNRDFGHYRGTFKDPKVVIVADPDGYDDLITARALTGTRGQYLHGLMEDLGVGDRYLVLKTAPFSMDEADLADWKLIVAKTKKYREALLAAVLADSHPELILTDGAYAAAEVSRILGSQAPCPVVAIERSGAHDDSGIAAAADKIRREAGSFAQARAGRPHEADIPRSHLSYYARLWEGTSGDRVITSTNPAFHGSAFAEVAPSWAYKQEVVPSSFEKSGIEALISKLERARLRKGGETIPDFMRRVQ